MTKEQAYDDLINPLMAQIIAICSEHKIPMFASFTLDLDDELQCTSSLLNKEWGPHPKLVEAALCLLTKRSSMLAVTVTKARRP